MAKKATTNKKSETVVAPAKQQTLGIWNLRAALFLAAQAVGVVIVGNKFSEAITVRYPSVDQLATTANKHQVLATATRHLFDVRLSYVAVAFLLIFAAGHMYAATSGKKKYLASLERGVNKIRWLTIGLGGGLILTTLSLMSGLNDLTTLSFIWMSVFLASLLALSVELLGANRSGLHKLLAVLAGVGAVMPWVVIIKSVVAAAAYGGHVPAYLWAVYASTFIFSGAFVMATAFRWKGRGQWTNVVYTEKMYLLLGFAMASAVAWQVATGVR